MAIVTLQITKIDNTNFMLAPVDIYDDKTQWLVEGTAVPADGHAIAGLTWNNGAETSYPINQNGLPNWSFMLPESAIDTTDGAVSTFYVNANDDDDPIGFAMGIGQVKYHVRSQQLPPRT
ncbi:MAG: hypothetical protein HYR84_13995 [Planctomycetes bacterium]|nr:hypothetical protein [Planctomycetota bacterium]